MFLQETVFEEKILEFAYVQKMHFFYTSKSTFFSLNFYFVQKCTEMIPEKGHKNQNWNYCVICWSLKMMVVFNFLVEISCSVQHQHLQGEPHPLLDPPESQPTLGLQRDGTTQILWVPAQRHLHPDLPPQLQTKLQFHFQNFALFSWSFLPARWNFAGSTVNVSFFRLFL